MITVQTMTAAEQKATTKALLKKKGGWCMGFYFNS